MPVVAKEAAAQTFPVAVFVAGQPGAGKSTFAALVHHALAHRGGAVRICSDDYKRVHPCYSALLAIDDLSAGVRTRPATRRWQAAVEDHTRRHRLNAVIETALADPEEARTTIGAYRRAGHRVELAVLAIPEALSSLAVLNRYLQQVRLAGVGRYVSAQNHDHCARQLPEVLRIIEAEQLAHRVTVIGSNGIRYLNQSTPNGRWSRPPRAAQAVRAERNQQWTATEARLFRRAAAHVGEIARDVPGTPRRSAVTEDIRHSLRWAAPLLRTSKAEPATPQEADPPRLPPAEHRRIFTDLIVPFHLGDPEPRRHPVAVYVVGQPGAGKTTASSLVLRAMRPGAVLVSSEDFRAFHPAYARLLAEHPRTAGALLRPDYRAWQNAAEEWLRHRRADVVIETAPANSTDLLASASRSHAAGYRVEMLVLAVRAADSRQGTAHRFALGLERSQPSRFTTPHGHDRCYRALAALATALDRHPAVHTVTVTGRDVRALGNRQGGTAALLEGERQRPYTNAEAARFAAVQHRLWTLLPRHRSELSEITALAAPLLPPGFPLRGLAEGVADHPALPALR
ncbi:zeta toxin family protein [Streptomyces sp. Amel2xC10]|uniref:zeta toxin family protein n=1 Tax=Streptomyces sp. Amel2xC10 TaxID=1305826 RepID=UPI000A0837BE|nr:zeta toxin family protein [Streptomyces sp. Amel2xC10]SMF51021.1 ATPase (PilT family) [Streptomyces sp. Amel2xC10]